MKIEPNHIYLVKTMDDIRAFVKLCDEQGVVTVLGNALSTKLRVDNFLGYKSNMGFKTDGHNHISVCYGEWYLQRAHTDFKGHTFINFENPSKYEADKHYKFTSEKQYNEFIDQWHKKGAKWLSGTQIKHNSRDFAWYVEGASEVYEGLIYESNNNIVRISETSKSNITTITDSAKEETVVKDYSVGSLLVNNYGSIHVVIEVKKLGVDTIKLQDGNSHMLWGTNLKDNFKKSDTELQYVIHFPNIGSESGTLVVLRDEKGLYFYRGCSGRMTLKQFEDAVEDVHGDNEHGKKYKDIISVMKLAYPYLVKKEKEWQVIMPSLSNRHDSVHYIKDKVNTLEVGPLKQAQADATWKTKKQLVADHPDYADLIMRTNTPRN